MVKHSKSLTICCWIIAAALIGVMAFLVVYGDAPLDVTNDAWIMQEYDELDIVQHYSGWLAFRNSPWAFPLGLAKDMAVGDGVIISFTDSIPWVAIFFKLFRGILPATFQYFGWYTLLCYVLQSVAGYLILENRTKNYWYSLLGTPLFAFAPILMERAFRHTALGSQWLILFSILLYFQHLDKGTQDRSVYPWFLLLEVLTIGIHPYFLLPVFAVNAVCVAGDFLDRRWQSAAYLVGQMIITVAVGYLLGALGHGISASRDGYGYYSMNLNALFNPVSRGWYYRWSAFLPKLPQTLGNYDGYNYLGVGIFGMVVLLGVTYLCGRVKAGFRRHWLMIAATLCLALFAVSNVVTWNDRVLFTVPLPEFVVKVCSIFRASSRMFYLTYYLIYIFLIVNLYRWGSKRPVWVAAVLLALCTALQLYDLRVVIQQKHYDMVHKSQAESLLDFDASQALDGAEYVICDNIDEDRTIAAWTHKNGLKAIFWVANSGWYSNCREIRQETMDKIFSEGTLGNVVVFTTDEGTLNWYLEVTDAKVLQYNNKYLLYS